MKKITIAITAASFSGNKGAAAMLRSSVKQLRERYGDSLQILLMSTYPAADKRLIEELPDGGENITVINAKPARLLFLVFPLAVLYGFMRFIPLLRRLFEINRMIEAYSRCDLVIDEAGISFVDSRGFIMNTYAFVCAAVPMLCGVPVVKYSQALGTFKNGWNRFLAKWILPKMKLICARGEITRQNLADIGITENVRLCADGAFTMPDSEYYDKNTEELRRADSFYDGKVAALSVSSVVQRRCEKSGIDYRRCMSQFADWLIGRGYNVLIIANAARKGSDKPRNNDLMICGEVYEGISDKTKARWYPSEMSPEEIRNLLAGCDCLVASRFHAMIGALEKGVPVLLVGWSHKYKEVLDMFGLGGYAVDFSVLELSVLQDRFIEFEAENSNIRAKIGEKLPAVKESSYDNIRLISEVIDRVSEVPRKGKVEKPLSEAPEWGKKEILRACKAVFGVLAAVFLVWYFWKNWQGFSATLHSVDIGIFVLSMLFYFVYKFTLASLWHYITKINGCSIKYEKAVTGYLYSILGKYIPGKVFMLAARLTYYKEENAPLSKVTVCFFIENICTLLGAAMLFIISLFFFPNELLESYKWITIVLIAAFFVCIHPGIINFLLRIVGKLFRKDLQIPMKYPQMLGIVLMFIANWLIVGAGFFMLVQSIYPDILMSQALFCAGVWGISAIMGILAVFAPSGIGVREGIIIVGLMLVMPESEAAVISVVSRLWQTIPELILVALAFLWSRARNMAKIHFKKNENQ